MSTLESNIKEVLESWKKKASAIAPAIEKGFAEGMKQFEGRRLLQQLSGRQAADYGLNVGSGNARNALETKIFSAGLDTIGVIAVAKRAWYLKVHQHFKFDGYIKPRNATALAIPISPAAKGKSPREFSDLVFIKRPGKAPLLIRQVKRGKNQRIVKEDIMYVLKTRVYVPKRLYFPEEFATYGRDMIQTNILRNLREVTNAK